MPIGVKSLRLWNGTHLLYASVESSCLCNINYTSTGKNVKLSDPCQCDLMSALSTHFYKGFSLFSTTPTIDDHLELPLLHNLDFKYCARLTINGVSIERSIYMFDYDKFCFRELTSGKHFVMLRDANLFTAYLYFISKS